VLKEIGMLRLRQPHVIATAVLLLCATSLPLRAQTYSTLWSFRESDGCCQLYPGLLAQGRDGNIYGTAQSGGANGWGNVFVMTPDGALTPIHDFNFTDGAGPTAGLNLGFDGNFYGATYQGGANSAGTVFRVTPGGTVTVLHSFANGTDGAFPRTPPTQAPDGNLYGATGNGTATVLYKITPAGVFSVVTSLPSKTYSPLIVAKDGNLYGMTLLGGTFNQGAAFQFNPKTKKVKIIYSFDQPTGDSPYGPLMQAKDGKLYGMTAAGGTKSGGVLFQMTTAGHYVVLYNFDNTDATNGAEPFGGVVQGSDGFLYGVTSIGGAFGKGTLFKVSTKGTSFTVLHEFDVSSGDTPLSTPLLHTNGRIYGMASHGGAFTVYGAVYSMDNGLKPFVSPFVLASGKAGQSVEILGQGFLNATDVKFGTGSAAFTTSGDAYLTATIQTGATTGVITVDEVGGNLVSPQTFAVVPTITSYAPTGGSPGDHVVITGTSLKQTTAVTIGKVRATFTIDSDTQITAVVGAGAVTGTVTAKTPGGTATGPGIFVVP
jgi:uncharacterized repeat protein (TIGR03803 family)